MWRARHLYMRGDAGQVRPGQGQRDRPAASVRAQAVPAELVHRHVCRSHRLILAVVQQLQPLVPGSGQAPAGRQVGEQGRGEGRGVTGHGEQGMGMAAGSGVRVEGRGGTGYGGDNRGRGFRSRAKTRHPWFRGRGFRSRTKTRHPGFRGRGFRSHAKTRHPGFRDSGFRSRVKPDRRPKEGHRARGHTVTVGHEDTLSQ